MSCWLLCYVNWWDMVALYSPLTRHVNAHALAQIALQQRSGCREVYKVVAWCHINKENVPINSTIRN